MDYSNPSNWHEAANLFPLLAEQELAELAADIKSNGLLNPIVLFEGKVLDGRNRLLACMQSDTTPNFTKWASNGQSPVSWVISQNVMRRDLTKSQKAVIAVEALPLLAEEAKLNQSQAGKSFGNGKKVAFDKTDNSYRPPLHARKELARQFGVSEGYINHAQHIKEQDPSRLEKIKSGAENISGVLSELEWERKRPTLLKPTTSSSSFEWYTPSQYIEAARKVLGNFDLDPASCEFASKTVKADTFYTKEQDGLEQPWRGKVWMNPPYGDIGPKFVTKLLAEYEAGNVTEAIVLLSANSTETKWFHPLFGHILCFTDHRVKFYTPYTTGEDPSNGSVFVYLGKNVALFTEQFSQFGSVVQSVPASPAMSRAA